MVYILLTLIGLLIKNGFLEMELISLVEQLDISYYNLYPVMSIKIIDVGLTTFSINQNNKQISSHIILI